MKIMSVYVNTQDGILAVAILFANTTTRTKVTNGMAAGVKTAICASKLALQ
jgi:hypothetical protein